MPPISPADFLPQTQAFLIWREGRSVKWDCTVGELAEATKIPAPIVRRICREKGYPARAGDPTVIVEDTPVQDEEPVPGSEFRLTDTMLDKLETSLLEEFDFDLDPE